MNDSVSAPLSAAKRASSVANCQSSKWFSTQIAAPCALLAPIGATVYAKAQTEPVPPPKGAHRGIEMKAGLR